MPTRIESKEKPTFTRRASNALLLAMVGLCMAQPMGAKSIKDIWVSMPDSMMPYLQKASREECINYMEMNLDASATNKLGDKCHIDTITPNYLSATLSECLTLQIKTLPTASGDSVLCVSKTYKGEAEDSNVAIYTQDWQKLSDIRFDVNELISKPDTMDDARMKELRLMLDPYVVAASLLPDEDAIVVKAAAASVSTSEAEQLKAILKQRKYRWDGNKFVL